jgi:hypothetical protein
MIYSFFALLFSALAADGIVVIKLIIIKNSATMEAFRVGGV